jgi:hypothetical protein
MTRNDPHVLLPDLEEREDELEHFERCKIGFIGSLLAALGVSLELTYPLREEDIEQLERRLYVLERERDNNDFNSVIDFSLMLISEVWVQKFRPHFGLAELQAHIELWQRSLERLSLPYFDALQLAACNGYLALLEQPPLAGLPDAPKRKRLISRLRRTFRPTTSLLRAFCVEQVANILTLEPIGRAEHDLRRTLNSLARHQYFVAKRRCLSHLLF